MQNRKKLIFCSILFVLVPACSVAMDRCDAALQDHLKDNTKIINWESRNLALNSAACVVGSSTQGGGLSGFGSEILGSADYKETKSNEKCESSSQAENMARFYGYASRSIKPELVQAWSKCKTETIDGLFCELQMGSSSTSARIRVVWRDAGQATVTRSTAYLMKLVGRNDQAIFNEGEKLPYGISEFIVEKSAGDIRKEGQGVVNATSGQKAFSCFFVWLPSITPDGEEGPECETLRTKISAVFSMLKSVPLDVVNCWESSDSKCAEVLAGMSNMDRQNYGQAQIMLEDAMRPLKSMPKNILLDKFGACSISESYGRFIGRVCVNSNPMACIQGRTGAVAPNAPSGGPGPIPVPGEHRQ
ncbi:hypothetical protein [Chromobacterium haemolyticum]|uniref:hypothetical protein n=1 Tax=Chromobacterium haemolyticum TaxID=394935 RepID=UPI0011301CC5|nr:hypothetical protein [Chromobacterium haemolyticum]